MRRLRVPWGPLLTQEEAQRGLAYYGSGQRLQAVVRKLMAGKPIKVRRAMMDSAVADMFVLVVPCFFLKRESMAAKQIKLCC